MFAGRALDVFRSLQLAIHTAVTDTCPEDIQPTLGDVYQAWGKTMTPSGFGLTVYVDDTKVWGPLIDDRTIDRHEDVPLEAGSGSSRTSSN